MDKLNINSLMVGDWVSPFGLPDIKVQVKPEDYVNLVEYEPIPLTPEILEKNGIKHQWGMPWYQGGYDEEGFEVHFALHCQMNLHYVHELQHALRLCGINKNIEL